MEITFLYGKCLTLVPSAGRSHWSFLALGRGRIWGSNTQLLAEWALFFLCFSISFISALSEDHWDYSHDFRGKDSSSVMTFDRSSNVLFQLGGCFESPIIFSRTLGLQAGICSSRAAALPLQWAISWNSDGGESIILFKGKGRKKKKIKKKVLLEMDVTESEEGHKVQAAWERAGSKPLDLLAFVSRWEHFFLPGLVQLSSDVISRLFSRWDLWSTTAGSVCLYSFIFFSDTCFCIFLKTVYLCVFIFSGTGTYLC